MPSELASARATNAKPYPRPCPECGETAVRPAEIAYEAEVKHDGRLHRFFIARLAIDKCERCGEELFTNRTDEQINAALRDHLGLLQPDDIRRRLDELGLSQRSFAERLGVAQETVSRWVTGLSIQTRPLDNLMRLFFGFATVRDALSAPQPLRTLGLSRTESAA